MMMMKMVTTKTWKTKMMNSTVCTPSCPCLYQQLSLTRLADAEQGYTIHDLNDEAEDDEEEEEEEEDDDEDEDQGAAGGQGTARVITLQGLGRLLGAPHLHFHPATETLNAPHHVHPDSDLHPTILIIYHLIF